MDKKSVMPVFAVAILGCIALMLSVIGGLYTYNTFLADAPAVHAQSTDRASSWTVTSIDGGSGSQLLVVITEAKNPLDEALTSKQMAVYEMKGNNGKCDLYFVGARTLEWDFKFWDEQGKDMSGKGWGPESLQKAFKKKK